MKYKPIQEIRDMIDGARHALGEVPMGRALFSALDQLAQAVDALAEREQNKVDPESTDWQENAMKNEELLKAIATARFAMAEAQAEGLSAEDKRLSAELQLMIDAASSWASLVLRPLSAHPERDGDYFGWSLNMQGQLKHKVILTWEDGAWSYDGAVSVLEHDSAFVWLDGALPPVPTEGT